MAAVITDVQPRSFRAGDEITITGSGFSPSIGQNRAFVNLGTAATLVSESDTVIVAEVPAGIPTNQQVEVIISRIDTQEASDPFTAWSLASLDEARDFSTIMPGQVPGPREAAHLDVDVPDVGQARDYERAAAHALRIANEILSQAGDIFTSDGTNPVRLPIGGGGMELHTRTAEALGLHWGPSSRWITLRFGAEISADAAAFNLKANGAAFSIGFVDTTEQGVPFEHGTLTRVGVKNHFGTAGDTLVLVRVMVNGAPVYSSGAISVPVGGSHVAAFTASVNQDDRVMVELTPGGGISGNPFNFTAAVRLREDTEAVRQADTIFVTDEVSVVKTGNQFASAQDEIATTDTVATELTRPSL